MNQTMGLIEVEHQQFLEEIMIASQKREESGALFGKVLRIYRRHMDLETRTVFPLLVYLSDRLMSKSRIDKSKLIEARDGFETLYDQMLREHHEISDLLKQVIALKIREEEDSLRRLAEKLLQHVELEEEILYPAAFASGDLIEWERELLGNRIKY